MTDMFADWVLREPGWLYVALYPWLYWIGRKAIGLTNTSEYASPELLPWARARQSNKWAPGKIWRHLLIILAWMLFAIALAGPRLPVATYNQEQAALPELLVAIDLSHSMSARDIEPSRIERAKLELEDLIRRAQQIKIGLVVYAARPHLLTPPTADKELLLHYLQVLHHGLLPTEGSDLNSTLLFCADSFISNKSARSVLIISDGGLSNETAVAQAKLRQTASILRQQDISLYALGVGTPEGAQLLAQEKGWLRHEGKAVISSLNSSRLAELASLGHGRYTPLTNSDADWIELYDEGIAKHKGSGDTTKVKGETVWDERFAMFLVMGSILLLFAYWQAPSKKSASIPVGGIVLLASMVSLFPADKLYAREDSLAYQAYQRESYQQARQLYAGIPGYIGRMGEGSSAYRLGQFQTALLHFTQAVQLAYDDRERADALFNLANCHYQLSQYATAETIYRDVLKYRPMDKASTVNLAYATALKKQQQEQGDGVRTNRQGRGPRSARLADGTEITRGGITMDETKNEIKEIAPPLDQSTSMTNAELIQQGIFLSRHADKKKKQFDDTRWVYDSTSPDQIQTQAGLLQVDESIFWKRIFETEENFNAPVDIPLELPNTQPW